MNRTLPMWSRSTDMRDLQECQMKWLLKRLYDPDYAPTWFPLGSGVHRGIYDVLHGGGALEEVIDGVKALIADMLETHNGAGLQIRGTKRRTPKSIYDDAERMLRKWHKAVMEGGIACYNELDLPESSCEQRMTVPANLMDTMAPLSTAIDAIIPLKDRTDVDIAIVDWKSGATASAGPLQLQTYLFAVRNDPDSPFYRILPEHVEMWYHHLDFDKIQRVEEYPGDAYIKAVIQWTEGAKWRMRDKGFAPAHPDWYCDYCTMRSHCPVWGAPLDPIIRDARLTTLDFAPDTNMGVEDGHDG